MKKYFEILRKCSLFGGVEDENLISMLGCLGVRVKAYDKKEAIVSEGDSAGEIGILLSGSAQIEQTDYFGNRSIVASIEPSELFGEAFACAGVKHYPVDVVATDAAEVMFVDCSRVLEACSNSCSFHRQIIYNLVRVVARKNIMFHQKIGITSKRTTREKLMAYLNLQAKKAGACSFDIPYDRQELADYLEVDRSGLSAEISKLRKEGVLHSEKNRFTLL